MEQEMCLKAVEFNGLALEFVKEQTPELCLKAVSNNGLALEFVKDYMVLVREGIVLLQC
jgi:hypothetical protein